MSAEREWQAQQRMTQSSSSKKPTRPLQTMAMRAPWEMAAPMTGSTLRPAQTARLPQWQGVDSEAASMARPMPRWGSGIVGLFKEAVLSTHSMIPGNGDIHL